MTTPSTKLLVTIIKLFNRNRSLSTIRAKYGKTKINYNCLTTLLGIYLLTAIQGKPVSKTSIFEFVRYYRVRVIYGYIDLLVEYNLLNLSGRYYSLTEKGLEAIREIANNNDNLLYSFCNKYNIEL